MFLRLTSLTSLPHFHVANAGEQEEQGGGDQEGNDDHGHPILGLSHLKSFRGRVVSLIAVAGVIVRGTIASVGHSVARVSGRLIARCGFLISRGHRGWGCGVLGVVSVVTSHSVRQAQGAVGQGQESESCEATVGSHVVLRCGVSDVCVVVCFVL